MRFLSTLKDMLLGTSKFRTVWSSCWKCSFFIVKCMFVWVYCSYASFLLLKRYCGICFPVFFTPSLSLSLCKNLGSYKQHLIGFHFFHPTWSLSLHFINYTKSVPTVYYYTMICLDFLYLAYSVGWSFLNLDEAYCFWKFSSVLFRYCFSPILFLLSFQGSNCTYVKC
jgi:hypothetical protein